MGTSDQRTQSKFSPQRNNIDTGVILVPPRKHTTKRKTDVDIRGHTQQHLPRKDCTCTPCRKDRLAGCSNPHKCAANAREILSKLAPKYDTNTKPKRDELSLTHRRKEKNTQAHESRDGEILFDPTTTIRTSLKECFRIFTDPEHKSQSPAHRLQNPTRGEADAVSG
ncbi:hypothetical protein P692DRAFT_20833944 [Suillus brevipes Sb2]|nr:hypothetical protein P692DRAFT_20833944 [Suillus brevipes Sb2]